MLSLIPGIERNNVIILMKDEHNFDGIQDEQISLDTIRRKLARSIDGLQKVINETEASIRTVVEREERWDLNDYRMQLLELRKLKNKVLNKIESLFYNEVQLDPRLDDRPNDGDAPIIEDSSGRVVYLHRSDKQLLERPHWREIELPSSR
ncbi:hypothetical protein FO519_000896 [Halicephalobus sp. NKZ332]|nr:hypothetical protein FO519_000896 [Halicephalobus sp. NKZ332]